VITERLSSLFPFWSLLGWSYSGVARNLRDGCVIVFFSRFSAEIVRMPIEAVIYVKRYDLNNKKRICHNKLKSLLKILTMVPCLRRLEFWVTYYLSVIELPVASSDERCITYPRPEVALIESRDRKMTILRAPHVNSRKIMTNERRPTHITGRIVLATAERTRPIVKRSTGQLTITAVWGVTMSARGNMMDELLHLVQSA